jgi:hypothetical protein
MVACKPVAVFVILYFVRQFKVHKHNANECHNKSASQRGVLFAPQKAHQRIHNEGNDLFLLHSAKTCTHTHSGLCLTNNQICALDEFCLFFSVIVSSSECLFASISGLLFVIHFRYQFGSGHILLCGGVWALGTLVLPFPERDGRPKKLPFFVTSLGN